MLPESVQEVLSQLTWIHAIIPLISAIIGWGTNVLALKMTFYPLEFIGVDIKSVKPIGWDGLPPLGWQGIVPAKAADMAGKSVDMITTKLIDVQEQFSLINPAVIAREMEPTVKQLSRDITDEVMRKHVPLWKLIPQKQKEQIYARGDREIPKVTAEIMEEVKQNITTIFDLKKMAVDQLTANKVLLNRIFLEVGDKEFRFIERSGFVFGLLFGLIQMFLLIIFDAPWQLPLGGLFVGYLTNVLALRMIFSPIHPINILGFQFQGLFLKRQKEVSRGYSQLISDNIMTMPNVFDAMFNGPAADKLVNIIKKHIEEGIDDTAGYNSALIKLTSGTNTYDEIKQLACERFIEAIPQQIHLIFDYAKQALDVEETLYDKMSNLVPDDFVGFLRPVFQEDEWKLILAGAVLGMGAGFLQMLLPLGV